MNRRAASAVLCVFILTCPARRTGAATILPASLSTNEIEKYLIVGFKKQSEGDAVNLQNGEFGADRQVLSQGGVSPTGASFPTINSVFDQRWTPQNNETHLVHPISGNPIAPHKGIDYSGNIAITSPTGRLSVSGTDIFADLGAFDASLDEIGVVAANGSNPVQSVSNADYFNSGASQNTPLGQLPTNSAGTNGVGFAAGVDLTPLLDELSAWQSFIDAAASEGSITQNIENENYKDGSAPFVIELLSQGGTANPAADLSFVDADGDGFVIVDVTRGGSDWEINNSDVIIDGPDGVTAIFRVNGQSNTNISNSSIQVGDGGIADDGFGAIFYKGDSEGSGSGDAVFSGNNVVFSGIALWELNEGTSDAGKNEIDIQNGQGCAQFIGSTVLHTSSSRFNLCTIRGQNVPEPASTASLVPIAVLISRRRCRPHVAGVGC